MQARILIVDDEKAMRLALKGLLAKEGYEVESTAGQGTEFQVTLPLPAK